MSRERGQSVTRIAAPDEGNIRTEERLRADDDLANSAATEMITDDPGRSAREARYSEAGRTAVWKERGGEDS